MQVHAEQRSAGLLQTRYNILEKVFPRHVIKHMVAAESSLCNQRSSLDRSSPQPFHPLHSEGPSSEGSNLRRITGYGYRPKHSLCVRTSKELAAGAPTIGLVGKNIMNVSTSHQQVCKRAPQQICFCALHVQTRISLQTCLKTPGSTVGMAVCPALLPY